MQLVSVQDVAWFTADVFETPARYLGRAIELAGDSVMGRSTELSLRWAGIRPAPGFTIPSVMRTRLQEDFRTMFDGMRETDLGLIVPLRDARTRRC